MMNKAVMNIMNKTIMNKAVDSFLNFNRPFKY